MRALAAGENFHVTRAQCEPKACFHAHRVACCHCDYRCSSASSCPRWARPARGPGVLRSRLRDLGMASTHYSDSNKGRSRSPRTRPVSAGPRGCPELCVYEYFADDPFDPTDPPDEEQWLSIVNEYYRSPLDRREQLPGDRRVTQTPINSFGQSVYFELKWNEIDPSRTGDESKPYMYCRCAVRPAETILFADLDEEADEPDHHMRTSGRTSCRERERRV